jgi:hypothetical protein
VDWLRLGRQPVDGLAVTMADGSPLPEAVKKGDELLYRVQLAKPASDVTVEAMAGAGYEPLPVNGEPYVQLVRIGKQDGAEWAAKVKLGKGSGQCDLKDGYPVVWRAVVTGGAIKETYTSMHVKFE